MKLLIKLYLWAQKQGKSEILMGFFEAASHFFFYITFHIFLLWISSSGQDDKKQKAILKSHFQNFIMVVQNRKFEKYILTKYKQIWVTIVV